MVFFNYTTMQMAAKVVYYGPGLCGKTTNLQHIYSRTSNDSRGEMVSLETETDRTLFFDLLPIDVGQIAGFNTRIQLYTVPGQVFYNTTRKLVLKGVDGVVFVADSQRAMVNANRESLDNLEENLGEMGLSLKSLPMVLQYNKRDLPDICLVEEMNASLNLEGRPYFQASAIQGVGVFETLKGISKLTLLSLKERLTAGSQATSPSGAQRKPAVVISSPAAPAARPAPAPAAAKPAAAPAAKPAARPVTPDTKSGATRVKEVDALGELEKIRRQTIASAFTQKEPTGAGANGRGEIRRSVELNLKRQSFKRMRRVSVTLQLEDENRQVVGTIRDLKVDTAGAESFQKLLLRLNIALNAEE